MSHTRDILEKRRGIARRINDVLGECPEVVCVFVHGSVASGTADERSDVDITFICRPEIMSLSTRTEVLEKIGSKWRFQDPSLDNALWSECDSDGLIDGVLVDIHYQTAAWISEVLDEVVERGAITTSKMPFRPYTLAALLQRSWLLRDGDGIFGVWLERTEVYPQRLKSNILRHFTPILLENLEELKATSQRGLGPRGFIFHLNWAVDALISILFALNEVYDPADRRMEQTVLPALTCVPRDFINRFACVLEGPFDRPGALQRARLFEQLAAEILDMAEIG